MPLQNLNDALNQLHCHHLLLILDCCFTNTFHWGTNQQLVSAPEILYRQHYDILIRYPAWQLISSIASNQAAIDLLTDPRGTLKNVPHSPFALALLEGLSDLKADLTGEGVVTTTELYLYIRDKLGSLIHDEQALTPGLYPLRGDNRGEYIFHKPWFEPQSLGIAPPPSEATNPYRGLKPFEEEHAGFFFGRAELVYELKRRLSQSNCPLTIVLGPSGAGKTSLIKAELIPYLRNEHGKDWRILKPLIPGELPFAALARTIWAIADLPTTVSLNPLDFLSERLNHKTEQLNTQVAKAASRYGETSSIAQPLQQEAQKFAQITTIWNQDTDAAKQLLIVEHFETLYGLCQTLGEPESQQQQQLKQVFLACLNPLTERLQSAPNSLLEIVKAWSQKHPDTKKLLLVIDQFEELITLAWNAPSYEQKTEPGQTQQFLQLLETAIEANPSQLHIVVTLRSGFESRLSDSPLRRYWKTALFLLQPMSLVELRQVIERPALKRAVYFDPPEMIDKLIDDIRVSKTPELLPLLSFTLSELYIKLAQRWSIDNISVRTLQIKDYEYFGGIVSVLNHRATEEYELLDDQHKITLRRVMLRMVVIVSGQLVRRRVPESDLVYSDDAENKRVVVVIDRLIKARLLVKGQENGEFYIEPVHDVLFREWNMLNNWIWQEQDSISLQNFIAPYVKTWQQNQRGAGYLLMDNEPRLFLLEKILESDNNWFNKLEIEFIKDNIKERYRKLSPAFKKSEVIKQGRSIVVVIGIDQYKYLPKLNNAVNDAREVQKVLTKEFGFTKAIPSLFNANATKNAIESLIEDKLPSSLKKDDNLLLFFAGHGETQIKEVGDRSVEVGHIVPVNAKSQFWSGFIRIDWLLTRVGELPAKHILVILDACKSGVALGEAKRIYRDEGTWRYQQDLLRKRSRKVITSARQDQLAQDGGGPILGHSLFTGWLINGLLRREADSDHNGIITSSELGLFVQQKVAQATHSSQTPDFGYFHLDDRGEMVISLRE